MDISPWGTTLLHLFPLQFCPSSYPCGRLIGRNILVAVEGGKELIFLNFDPGKAMWQLLSAECGDQTSLTVV